MTAVAGTEGEADQPSRFLAELGVPIQVRSGRPRRPLSLAALVGELRGVSVDPDASPALREQAASRLARLSDAASDGHRLAPGADPAQWWGLQPLSSAARPVVQPDEPVRMSGSQLAGVLACPRQWFLSRQAQAESARSAAATLRLGDPRADRPRGPDRGRSGRADRPSRCGLASARLRRQLAVGGRAGGGGVGPGAVRDLAGGPAGHRAAGHRGGVLLLGRSRHRAGPAERQCRPGRTGRGRPDPDRGLQDRKDPAEPPPTSPCTTSSGSTSWRSSRGRSPSWPGPVARPGGAELVYLRLSDGPGSYPRVFAQASLDDVPFPLASRSRRPTRTRAAAGHLGAPAAQRGGGHHPVGAS